jgi:hypothetical protein
VGFIDTWRLTTISACVNWPDSFLLYSFFTIFLRVLVNVRPMHCSLVFTDCESLCPTSLVPALHASLVGRHCSELSRPRLLRAGANVPSALGALLMLCYRKKLISASQNSCIWNTEHCCLVWLYNFRTYYFILSLSAELQQKASTDNSKVFLNTECRNMHNMYIQVHKYYYQT